MDNGYAERNLLGVVRTRYTGAGSYGKNKKASTAAVRKKNKAEKVSTSPKTVAQCASVREKYRISSSYGVMPRTASGEGTAVRTKNKAKGFVYVEHSGFAGTFRDVFCTRRVKSTEKSCFDKIVLVLLFAVLMFFVAGSYCEYYEAFRKSREIELQIDECREEQAKLLVAIEERNNSLDIDGYAVNTLGMVKSDKLTKHFISISEKDVVNITVNEEQDSASGGVLLSGFKSVVSNIIGEN